MSQLNYSGFSILILLMVFCLPALTTADTIQDNTFSDQFGNNDLPGRDDPEIMLDPQEIMSELLTGERENLIIEVINEGDELLEFRTSIEIISEPERQAGPRRDDVDLDGLQFAVFQNQSAWGWLDEAFWQDPLIDNENLTSYRNPNDWNDVNFEDYDVIIMSAYNQGFVNQYNENFERFSEYIDNGGNLYVETGNANALAAPGNIINNWDANARNGVLVVSPDNDDDNYSRFAEICQEEQPDFWDEGEVIEGSSFLHSGYRLDQFEEGVDDGDLTWYQVIAVHEQNQNIPGAVAYGYGRGTVLTVGHPVGHCWTWFNEEGQWGSIGAEILYFLTSATANDWLATEPTGGEVDAGESMEVTVMIDAYGLAGGVYEGSVHFLSNDPDDADAVVNVLLEVTPAPDINVVWSPDHGYPDAVDWNMGHLDLFVGHPYEMEVDIVNEGTEILEIEDIVLEGNGVDFFTMEPAEDFGALEPGQKLDMTLTLETEESGRYELDMIITSDDPDEEDYFMQLVANPGEPPVIFVDPDEIQREVLGDEVVEAIINIENAGEAPLRFGIDFEVTGEPERDQNHRTARAVESEVPLRDEPGDLLDQFNIPNGGANSYNAGLCFDQDNEYMWVAQYQQPARIIALDPEDYNVESEFNHNNRIMGIAWLEGHLYMIEWANNWLVHYDTEGNNLGNINLNFRPTAVASSPDLGILFVMEDNPNANRPIHVFSVNDEGQIGEELGNILSYRQQMQQIDPNNASSRSLEWVDIHPDGQLWVNTRNNGNGNQLWQFAVDEDEWSTEFVQRFQSFNQGNGQEWDGIGHDGTNLWATSYALPQMHILDDGIEEAYWLTITPTEGVIEGEDDLDVFVTLDGDGLFTGEYEAEIYIRSNDPEDPEVTLLINLFVTGAPRIAVEWPEEAGWAEQDPVMNWNMYHPDIFIDQLYEIPVTIENTGTDLLTIEDISSDVENFTCDPQQLEIPIESEEIVMFQFTTEEVGEYEATMTISSDDPNNDEVEITLQAQAFSPPVIAVNPNEVQDALMSQEESAHMVNIANEGQAELRWDTDLEVIAEGPEIDRSVRTARSIRGPVAINPNRDELNGRGILIQERCGWNNWDFEQYFRAIDDFEYDRFRTWNDVRDVDFGDYDYMWIGNYETDAWVAAYNQNLERIEEFVDGGGVLYHSSGTNNHNTRPENPGGLVYRGNQSQNDCPLMVDPEENWLVNYMNENDPFNWEWTRGQRLHGNGCAHGTFLERDLDDIDNSDWFQIIAEGNPLREPIILTYQYGRGYCVVSTTTDGFLHARPQDYHWGRTGEAMLYYLDHLASTSRWVTWEPTDGTIEPGGDVDMEVKLDATGLFTGEYEADIHILSNDPENPDVAISVFLEVTGFPIPDVTWSEDWGYPNILSWNDAYEELFTGGPYPLPITIENNGTDDLIVESVVSDHEFFTTEWDENLHGIVPGEEEAVFNVILNAEDNGEHSGLLTITFGDGLGEVEVWISGITVDPPVLVIEPGQIDAELFTGEMTQRVINLTNDGDADLTWTSETIILLEAGEEPRDLHSRSARSLSGSNVLRDDPGDLMHQFALNHNWLSGFDWDEDNSVMWAASYAQPFIHAYEYDGEGNVEVVFDQNLNANTMGMGYYEGIIHTNLWAQQTIYRYNEDGDNVGNVNVNFVPMDYGHSYDNGWLIVLDSNRNLHFLSVEDDYEEVAVINGGNLANEINGQWFRAMCWVDDHPDGQLWVGGQNFVAEFFIDEDFNFELVQQFQVQSDNAWCAVGHDGEFIWRSVSLNDGNVNVYDDGVDEINWIEYQPAEGLIEPGADTDMFLTLNAEGLIAGDYLANINIYSNDPRAPLGEPDRVVEVAVDVVGVPNILVIPGGENQGPVIFDEAFFGYPTSREVTIINEGTDDLVIQEVLEDGNNPDFYVELEDIEDFFVRAGEREILDIWYNPDPERGDGAHEATLTFMTNDPNWEDGYFVNVRCLETGEAPVLILEPQQIVADLAEGDEIERVINAANVGGSVLVFDTDIEVLEEPGGQDLSVERTARSINPSQGPVRDVPEGTFALFQDTETFGWVEQYVFEPIDDLEYDFYRNAADLLDVNLMDYTALWVETGNQSNQFRQNWDNNLERFEEYVARGGVMFIEQGHNEGDGARHTTPGGLDFVWMPDEGRLVAEPEDNWLVDQMGWEAGQLFPGGSFTHVTYPEQNLENIDNSNWYQIIVEGQNSGEPAVVQYNYGSGMVIASGSPCGHQWRNHNQDGRWGSCGEKLLEYMSMLSTGGLISLDPANDEIEAGGDRDIIVTINTEGAIGGHYEIDIHFLSNDPENPDQTVRVSLDLEGRPVVAADPLPHPFEEAEDIVLNGTFYSGQEYAFPITIRNIGSEVLEIEGIDLSDDENWRFDFIGNAIPARGETTGELVFMPQDVGDFETELLVTTNATNIENGEIWWNYAAGAMDPPSMIMELPDGGNEINVSMMLQDDPVEMVMMLTNEEGDFRDDLQFSISTDEAEPEDDLTDRSARSTSGIGPLRDDPGDIISQVQSPINNVGGMAFDGELIWGASYGANSLVAYSPEEDDFVFNQNIHNNPLAMTFDGELLWIGGWAEDIIRLYDLDGEVVEQFNVPFRQVAGMGSDQTEYVYMLSRDDSFVHVISIDDREEIVEFDPRPAMGNNANIWGIDWVADHRDGQLWGLTNGRLYQAHVDDEWNVEAVTNFQVPADQPYVGPVHDGENMWHAMWNNQTWYEIDDGNEEGLVWLTTEPEAGVIEPGNDMDIFLAFNPEGLENESIYHGVLIIETNDPDNALVHIPVSLRTGVPDISHFDDFRVTGRRHRLDVLELTMNDEFVPLGWEIGVFNEDDDLCGGCVWTGEATTFHAYASGDGVEQFEIGEQMSLLVWDNEGRDEHDVDVDLHNGNLVFVVNGSTEMSLHAYAQRTQELDLVEGWNTISLNVDPRHLYGEHQRGVDVPILFEDLRIDDDNHRVELLKDDRGRFWTPRWGFNNIMYYEKTRGCQIKMTEDFHWELDGAIIPAQHEIPVDPGWNIVAYFPTYELDAAAPNFYVLSNIIDLVVQAKDNRGNFLSPAFNFSNMAAWTEGQGYYLKMDAGENMILTYPEEAQGDEIALSTSQLPMMESTVTITGQNMSVLIDRFNDLEVSDGNVVTAFDSNNRIIGNGIVKDGRCGLSVWGDDNTTNATDGLSENEAFRITLEKQETGEVINLTVDVLLKGRGLIYKTNGFTVLQASRIHDLPEEFYLEDAYPNPFNSTTTISFGVPDIADVNLNVYDLSGRLVSMLYSGEIQAGHHKFNWQAANIASGLYMVKMQAGNFNASQKVILVR